MEHILIQCLQSKVETNGNLYGCFELGPFNKNHSLTIGNAIRRTLLSELSGIGILCVEIQGIKHEYSHLKDVRESALDIVLNLKQIVFFNKKKLNQPEIGFLNVHGPTVVKSSSLKLPPGIQCVNPNQYIATLGETGTLKMKFLICTGKNYLLQTSFVGIEKYFQSHFYMKNTFNLENMSTWKTSLTEQIAKVFFLKKNDFFLQKSIKKKEKNNSNTKKNNKFLYKSQKINQNTTVNSVNYIKFQLKNKKTKKINLHFKKNFLIFEKKLLLYKQKVLQLQQINNIFKKRSFKRKTFTNVLFLDTVFTPIKKVNFITHTINQYPKIQKSNFLRTFEKNYFKEKLVLEIWTNGSIHPQTALYQAVQKFIELFVPLQTKYTIKKNSSAVRRSKLR